VLRLLCIPREAQQQEEEERGNEDSSQSDDEESLTSSEDDSHDLTVAEIKMVALDDRFIRPFLTHYKSGDEVDHSTRLGQLIRKFGTKMKTKEPTDQPDTRAPPAATDTEIHEETLSE